MNNSYDELRGSKSGWTKIPIATAGYRTLLDRIKERPDLNLNDERYDKYIEDEIRSSTLALSTDDFPIYSNNILFLKIPTDTKFGLENISSINWIKYIKVTDPLYETIYLDPYNIPDIDNYCNILYHIAEGYLILQDKNEKGGYLFSVNEYNSSNRLGDDVIMYDVIKKLYRDIFKSDNLYAAANAAYIEAYNLLYNYSNHWQSNYNIKIKPYRGYF